MNKYFSSGSRGADRKPRGAARRGFTLVELLVAMGLISLLAGIGFAFLGRGRSSAGRVGCDVQLKTLALALDAFKQENGRYPARLSDLAARKYLPEGEKVLRCPQDPRADGSYADGYVVRAAREAKGMGEVPLLLCPFHEDRNHGAQAYNARFTQQWMTAPARLAQASGASVERPGKGSIAGAVGMALHGGDRVRASGGAVIQFADGSTATLSPGADATVLQSFTEGNGAAPLYTIVRQSLGEVYYRVHHGSKFDVSTPTATAGARGTEFTVKVAPDGNAIIRLHTPSPLYVSTARRSVMAKQDQDVTVNGGVLGGAIKLIDGVLGGLL
jgi:prepilin-type N-terminal cleavage/methylation domain-containing protein